MPTRRSRWRRSQHAGRVDLGHGARRLTKIARGPFSVPLVGMPTKPALGVVTRPARHIHDGVQHAAHVCEWTKEHIEGNPADGLAGEGVDLIRDSVRVVLRKLINLKATERNGSAPSELTEGRESERNGHRPRMSSIGAPGPIVALISPKVESHRSAEEVPRDPRERAIRMAVDLRRTQRLGRVRCVDSVSSGDQPRNAADLDRPGQDRRGRLPVIDEVDLMVALASVMPPLMVSKRPA